MGNALDHSRFPLARLAAARGNLIPGGGVVRDDRMESYVQTWGGVQAMAQRGQFSPGYLRGVIRDPDRLTEVQKIKMCDQFAGLYD